MILLVYEMTEFIISWVDIILPSINIKITGSAIQDISLEVRDHRIMDVILNSTCVAFNRSLVCVYVLFFTKKDENMLLYLSIMQVNSKSKKNYDSRTFKSRVRYNISGLVTSYCFDVLSEIFLLIGKLLHVFLIISTTVNIFWQDNHSFWFFSDILLVSGVIQQYLLWIHGNLFPSYWTWIRLTWLPRHGGRFLGLQAFTLAENVGAIMDTRFTSAGSEKVLISNPKVFWNT